MPSGSCACSSSRDLSSRSAAVNDEGSVKSVGVEVLDSITTLRSLSRLLASTYALVFVSMTLVASAPAPATPTPAPPEKLADRLAAIDHAWMLAFSVAWSAMSPDLLLTCVSAFLIEASTVLLTVLRAILAEIESVPATNEEEAPAIVAAAVSTSILEVSVAERKISEPRIPPLPSPSMEAITCMPTVLIELAPDPAPAPPENEALERATAPARTSASTVWAASAVIAILPLAVTVEFFNSDSVVPVTSLSASEAPMATARPACPPAAERETAATVASIVAVFTALSFRPPRLSIVLSSIVACVSLSIVLVAAAPPPLRLTPAPPAAAIDTDAEMQWAMISLVWTASRVTDPGAVVPVDTPVIHDSTSASTVLVALVAAMATEVLAAPLDTEIVPPIAWALIVASSSLWRRRPPDARTLEFARNAWTTGVTMFSVTDAPTEPATPPPPSEPAIAKAPATARMFARSSAETVIQPPLAAMPSGPTASLTKASVVLLTVLPEPAPAPANFPPVPEPAATATPIVHAWMVGSEEASMPMPPALVSFVVTTEAVVVLVTRFSAAATPAATPNPAPLGMAMPTPPAIVQIFDFSSSALTRTLDAPVCVVVTPTASAITASVAIRTVLMETEPPSEKLPAAAPATVTLLISPWWVAWTSILPACTDPSIRSSDARTELTVCEAEFRGSPPRTL